MIADRILIADNHTEVLHHLGNALAGHNYEVALAADASALARCLTGHVCDIALIDADFNGDGMGTAHRLHCRKPDLPCILMAEADRGKACTPELLAHHYALVHKPVDLGRLLVAIDQAASMNRLQRENKTLRQQWEDEEAPDAWVSHSPLMIDLLRQAAKAAETEHPIILCGPAGTETDLIALYVHRCSSRSRRPFIRFQCGLHPPCDHADALFGCEHVSPTGEAWRSHGLADLAAGGTLFIENLTRLATGAQAHLLRFIEEDNGQASDVRLLCSAQTRTGELSRLGGIRRDLLFRLNALALNVPPLVERRGDILPLARRFAERFARALSKPVIDISDAAAHLLEAYSWPGNTEELRHTIQMAVFGALGNIIAPEDLLRGPARAALPGALSGVAGPSLNDVERQWILATLEAVGQNKAEAAQRLGLSLSALCGKLARYHAEGLLPSGVFREVVHA